MFRKKGWKLNESMLYFQQVNIDDVEEARLLKAMLKSAGWATCPMIAKSENHTIDEALDGLNALINKGFIWWTEINGERWYRIKPMPKKEMKAIEKHYGL